MDGWMDGEPSLVQEYWTPGWTFHRITGQNHPAFYPSDGCAQNKLVSAWT
jgi:hypothetical protein